MATILSAIARGKEGTKYSDFTTGTSSAADRAVRIRILDGVTPTKVEVFKALEAFERFFQNQQQVTTAGFDVKGSRQQAIAAAIAAGGGSAAIEAAVKTGEIAYYRGVIASAKLNGQPHSQFVQALTWLGGTL
jgi:hypothetical protein